jgi:hypothetical protein
MRLHYILNNGGTPESKLADVEVHFDEGEGPLAGLKLVGCSVWRTRKEGEGPSVLIPSRPYSTAGGMRYFDLLRPSSEGEEGADPTGKATVRRFRDHVRDEYLRIAALPEEGRSVPTPRAAGRGGRQGACA